MHLRIALSVAVAFTIPCSVSFASSLSPSQVTGITAFGDSLTDTGNVYIATGGALPGPGYAPGRYTNPQTGGGPAGLWIDQFAAQAGVTDPGPALAGGTNYAVGSALTGNANPQDMGNQVGLFLSTHPLGASSSALYTFWGGANNIFNGGNPVSAADNIENEIKAIAAAGGQNFLWLNLPDLGDVPALSGNALASAAANLASQAFDAEWATDTSALDALGINVIGVDVNTLFNNILMHPATYGFMNVTSACDTTAGCDPNTSLYWDIEHPTTYADSLVANLAYTDAFGPSVTATPEPSSITLLALGGVGFLVLFRLKRKPLAGA